MNLEKLTVITLILCASYYIHRDSGNDDYDIQPAAADSNSESESSDAECETNRLEAVTQRQGGDMQLISSDTQPEATHTQTREVETASQLQDKSREDECDIHGHEPDQQSQVFPWPTAPLQGKV